MAKILLAIKRTIFPILLLFSGWAMLYYLKMYMPTDEPLGWQLFVYKALLPNTGFLNAHVVRKLAFREANWLKDTQKYNKILIIVLYAMFIWAYAVGG